MNHNVKLTASELLFVYMVHCSAMYHKTYVNIMQLMTKEPIYKIKIYIKAVYSHMEINFL